MAVQKSGIRQSLQHLSTRIFRCPGWAPQSSPHDALGWHDLLFWLLFGSLLAAWYFLLHQPQRERQGLLEGRRDVLQARLRAERIELQRIQRELSELALGHPQAWERAARARLGWLKPGEVVELPARKRALAPALSAASRPSPSSSHRPRPRRSPAHPPVRAFMRAPHPARSVRAR